MQSSLTHIGLDVHQRSISVAVLRAGASGADEDQIPNEPAAIRRLVARWGDPAPLRVCYEAGPCGYGLQRQLTSVGIDCQVIAPALIPRRAGDRVKTDRRDALKLARLHRAGELTAVAVAIARTVLGSKRRNAATSPVRSNTSGFASSGVFISTTATEGPPERGLHATAWRPTA